MRDFRSASRVLAGCEVAGGGRVSLEFERVITANWGDDSVRSLEGYEAKGGYAGSAWRWRWRPTT